VDIFPEQLGRTLSLSKDMQFRALLTLLAVHFKCVRAEPPKADAGSPTFDSGVSVVEVAGASVTDGSNTDADAQPLRGLQSGRYLGRGYWGAYGVGRLTIEVFGNQCTASYQAGNGYTTSSTHRLTCFISEDESRALVHETRCVIHYMPLSRGKLQNSNGEPTLSSSPCYPLEQGIHGSVHRIDRDGGDAYELEVDPSTLSARKAAQRSVGHVSLRYERRTYADAGPKR
jgi:hypothetical protein